MATFQVDDVSTATEPLPTQPPRELCPDALIIGGDPDRPLLLPDGVHPLLSAIGRAFVDHRPLTLPPDAMWPTITQGIATHIRLNAEQLRPLLVSHTGRKRLAVSLNGPLPQTADSWHGMVDEFHKLLDAEIRDTQLFERDFSTSTDVDRIAARIVLLDAHSPYFALSVLCVCGIPSITLTGTGEDWRKIRSRMDAVAEFGLEAWARSLTPITDQFVRAAGGDVDTAFWQRIYNPNDAYGGSRSVITS